MISIKFLIVMRQTCWTKTSIKQFFLNSNEIKKIWLNCTIKAHSYFDCMQLIAQSRPVFHLEQRVTTLHKSIDFEQRIAWNCKIMNAALESHFLLQNNICTLRTYCRRRSNFNYALYYWLHSLRWRTGTKSFQIKKFGAFQKIFNLIQLRDIQTVFQFSRSELASTRLKLDS